MLVLTRKSSETVRIGNDIIIKVIRTANGSVKLGIDAPREVRVMRGELCDDSTAVALSEAEAWTPIAIGTQSAV